MYINIIYIIYIYIYIFLNIRVGLNTIRSKIKNNLLGFLTNVNDNLSPIQDGSFGGSSRMGGLESRSSLESVTLTLPKEDPKKYMSHVTQPSSSADISIFYWKSANFAVSKNTDIDCILIYNF